MQANLTRLNDLTGELRRQLKPLGRQAEVARRAAGIQADLRDSRLRLLADDYVTLIGTIAAESADEAAALRHRAAVQKALAEASEAAEAATASAAVAGPEVGRRAGHLVRALRTGRALPWHRVAGRGTRPQPVGAARGRRGPVVIPTNSRRPPRLREEAQAEKDEAVQAGPRRVGRRGRPAHRGRERTESRRKPAAGRDQGHRRPPRGPGPAVRPGQRGQVPAGGQRRRDGPAGRGGDRCQGPRGAGPRSVRRAAGFGGRSRLLRGRPGRGPRIRRGGGRGRPAAGRRSDRRGPRSRSANRPACGPGSTASPRAWNAGTAPGDPGCGESTTRSAGFGGRRCWTSIRVSRAQWPRLSGRRPTRSPSPPHRMPSAR